MLSRSRSFPAIGLRLVLAASVLGTAAACGAGPKTTVAPEPTSPFLAGPPAAVGDGLVCGAAADRLLGIHDGFDLREFTQGPKRPQNATIHQALTQYLTTSGSAARQQAAGLIEGQCEAYGFYPVTYQDCVRASKGAINDVVRGCIERRRWTVYTQQ
jgi:hypothetical protein